MYGSTDRAACLASAFIAAMLLACSYVSPRCAYASQVDGAATSVFVTMEHVEPREPATAMQGNIEQAVDVNPAPNSTSEALPLTGDEVGKVGLVAALLGMAAASCVALRSIMPYRRHAEDRIEGVLP